MHIVTLKVSNSPSISSTLFYTVLCTSMPCYGDNGVLVLVLIWPTVSCQSWSDVGQVLVFVRCRSGVGLVTVW